MYNLKEEVHCSIIQAQRSVRPLSALWCTCEVLTNGNGNVYLSDTFLVLYGIRDVARCSCCMIMSSGVQVLYT